MPSRIPSNAQLRSQMRRAQRQAENEFKREVNRVQQKLESELKREAGKAARAWESEVKKEARRIDRENVAAQKKATSQLEGEVRRIRRRSRPSVSYTPGERRYLDTVQSTVEQVEDRRPDLRDVFLCHAWADRAGPALELHDALHAYGVDVWFSEKDVPLGVPLTRALDQGLRTSKVGAVLVTPAMLESLRNEGIADKELSALLATDRVIPIVHRTTFEDLRDESPLLASRSGLSTEGSSLDEVAAKIAETLGKPVDPGTEAA